MTASSADARTSARFLAVVICDEVRTENNGKQILIGVYGGSIVVPVFPFTILISLWTEHEFFGVGDLPLDIRLINGRGEELFLAGFTVELEGYFGPGGTAFGRIPVTLNEPTELAVEYREHGGDWVRLRTKPVIKAGDRPKAA